MPRLPSVPTSQTDATGSSGARLVQGLLQGLRQGVNLATDNDVGTDFHMELRIPSTGEGIGLTVGGQIKSGLSFFEWSGSTDEDGSGWWFYEKEGDAHFGLWSLSSIPYILVLYNPQTTDAHWVHVSETRIVNTNSVQGKKIFVPGKNLLNADAIDQIIEIAKASYLRNPYQGTIWRTSDLTVQESIRYRVALIAPRLIAPHPNQGRLKPQDPCAAIGIVLTGFSHYLQGEQPDDDLPHGTGWGWMFYDAFAAWMAGEGVRGIKAALFASEMPSQRAAAAVLLVAALVDDDRPNDALDALRSVDLLGMTETDICWLRAHETQLLYDLGCERDAKDLAVVWLNRARRIAGDITLEPIIASLTSTVFRLSDWEGQDVKTLIQSRDNLSAWWRAFSMESVPSREVDFSFSRTGVNLSKVADADVESHNRLTAAAVTCLMSANYESWRAYSNQLAKLDYARLRGNRSDGAGILNVINTLRMCNSPKEVGAIAYQIWMTGPVDDLSKATIAAGSARVTRHSLDSCARLFQHAGDLLPTDMRSRLVSQ
ncbi:DUF4365 domain-containing protein [Nakamurella lactea]|uniref:DUF4365 domain-containing protein n=1 Tax=Nakamurella lactea TaxID=459515 RepID=UPI0024802B4B|nr:DUF4365 domain-containing protein [Nakamurella lactea]